MGSKLIAAAGAAFLASAFLGLAAPTLAANGPDIITSGSFSGPHVNTSQEVERGRAALAASDYRDAQDAFRRVTELTPNDADAWYDLGQAASGLGETRSAEHAFARSVAPIRPDTKEVTFETQFGPWHIEATFRPKDMLYHGQLAL